MTVVGSGDAVSRLREFAKTHTQKRGPSCSICTLPPEILAAAETLRAEGLAFSVIGGWLRSEGRKIADATVTRHFRQHDGR